VETNRRKEINGHKDLVYSDSSSGNIRLGRLGNTGGILFQPGDRLSSFGDVWEYPIGGADKLKLAGQPFSITLYVCQSKTPSQTSANYAVYASVELTGTVKSLLITTPYTIKPTAMTFVLVHPPDTIQVLGPITVFGVRSISRL